jgi:SAM-dependent methyltransferase
MKENTTQEYYTYLRKRSVLTYLYRKFLLYPVILRNVKGNILDVGCGIGDLLSYNKKIIGVDINPNTIAYCNNKGFDARLMKINELPFQSRTFECVVLDNVLEHVENPTLLLNEISRVLKKKGLLIIGVPGVRGYDYDPDHKKYYSKVTLISLMKSHNYTLLNAFGMPLNINWLSHKMRQYCLYARFKKN